MTVSRQAPAPDRAAALGARLDRLRWGPAHLGILVLLGIGWLFDSLEVNLVGSFVDPMERHFGASDTQVSFIVWFWLVGILVGALIGGRLADVLGRRRVFVVTLLWYAGFTMVTALSPSLDFLLGARFLTALGVGAEYAVINAAIAEFMPARHRGKANAAVMNFWPAGAIAAGFIALLFLNTLALGPGVSWRYGFGLGGAVALIVMLFRRRLPESPRWLVGQGRYEEAEAIVRRLERASGDGTAPTGPPGPATGTAPGCQGLVASVVELITRYPGRVALGCALDLSEAFGYYGVFALVSIVGFRAVGISDADVPYFFIVGNVGGLAGGVVMTLLFDRLGRRVVVPAFFVLAAASAVLLGLALDARSAGMVLLTFVISNAFATGAWTSAYPTFTELFPTHLRGAGVGLSVAVGRLGAGYGAIVVTRIADSGGVLAATVVVGALWLVGAAAMGIWTLAGGVEASGLPLETVAPGPAAAPVGASAGAA